LVVDLPSVPTRSLADYALADYAITTDVEGDAS
jgi:hypothetical protein